MPKCYVNAAAWRLHERQELNKKQFDRNSRTTASVLKYDSDKVWLNMHEVRQHTFKGRCPHKDRRALSLCSTHAPGYRRFDVEQSKLGVKPAAAERAQEYWPW